MSDKKSRNSKHGAPGYDTVTKKHKKKKRKRHSTAKRVVLIIVLVILGVLIAGGAYAAYLVASNYNELGEWSEITMDQTSNIFDKEGNFLVAVRGVENREIVDYSAFPQYLIDALIATEDTRFYDHAGVDVIRIGGSLIANLKSGSKSQGASTLTMQLARNAILERQDKAWDRKIKEALLALQIERKYSKDEILTFYLNEVYMGSGTYGVETASQRYFNKSVNELGLSECAMLVGLLKSPENYSPVTSVERATSARNVVLDNMVRAGTLDEATATATKGEELVLDIQELPGGIEGFSYYIDYAIVEAGKILADLGYSEGAVLTGGFNIYTSMDPATQAATDEQYANDALFPKGVGEDQLQSAAIFVEPDTGYIWAMAGGRQYETRLGMNYATDMKRQPGSSIKPIAVYAPALEEGYSPNYMVNDTLTTFNGNYTPRNYDGSYRGLISLTTAVKYSVNVAAVKMLNTIGVDTGYNFAIKCGLPLVEQDKGLALALGGITNGVSLLNLATAYSCFANGGYYIEPTSIVKITDRNNNVVYEHVVEKERVMKETTAYAMTTMLKATIESGTGTRGNLGRPAAGKTGTTQLPDSFGNRKGNKDSWWAGYTPDLVGICWMGFEADKSANGTLQYMVNVYGGQYPVKVWKNIMMAALANIPATDFVKPEGYSLNIFDHGGGEVSNTVSVTICTESGMLATENCPSTTTKRYEKGDSGIPTKSCTIHKGTTPDPDNPGTTNPGGTNPGGTNPGGTDPGGTDPGGTDPGGTDPGGTDPGGTDPGGTDPGGTDPGGTDPGGTDPGGTDPNTSTTQESVSSTNASLTDGAQQWLTVAAVLPKLEALQHFLFI